MFDQESTQDRENPSVFSSTNHADNRDFGNRLSAKHLNLIQSKDTMLMELPENEEIATDRQSNETEKLSYSASNKTVPNIEIVAQNSQKSDFFRSKNSSRSYRKQAIC